MNRKSLGILCGLLFALLAASLVANAVLFVVSVVAVASGETQESPRQFREQLIEKGSSGKIVHIDVEGLITTLGGPFGGSMVEEVKGMLDAAAKDPRVKGVVLRVNSPGGEVTASDVLHHAVQQLAARKPVLVFMDSVAASGGYYIACGGSKIMANETSVTGSIGVIIQTLNYGDLLGKIGVEAVAFTSGRYKDTLSPSREMRPDEREMVQGMVDGMFNRFLGIVSASRGIAEEDLRNGIADGRIFTGSEAKEKGLIDATGYLEDAYAEARRMAGSPDAAVVRYLSDVGWGDLLGFLGKGQAAPAGARFEVDVSDRLLPRLEAGQFYFLPPSFAR